MKGVAAAAASTVLLLGGCRPELQPEPQSDAPSGRAGVVAPAPVVPVKPELAAQPEASLGVEDLGVFSDLDDRVQIGLAELEPADVEVIVDEPRSLLLLYADARPLKVYPLLGQGGRVLDVGGRSLRLRRGDHAQLAPLLVGVTPRVLEPGTTAPPGDRDRDGIPDPVDLDLGAIKTTLNAASYNQDYFTLPYPGATALPYAEESASLRCVDDPGSQHYGEIVDGDTVTQDWSSAEAMRRLYALAIVIEHNAARTAEAGSCIFLHAWDGPDSPVTGCTAMAADDLDTLARWLAPGAVVVALPVSVYDQLSEPWSLPSFAGVGG